MSGFDKVPTNPYQERADAFRKQNEPGGTNPPTQTTDQQTAPAQPADVQPAPVQQPVNPPSAPVQQPAPVQPVATQSQNTGTYYDPALIQNLAYERDQLRQQLAADQQKMADLQKSADELNDLRRRASIRADIQQQAIDNLESVSPEDYTAIVESATNLAMAQTEPLKKELEQQRKELEERTRYNQQMLENTRKDLLNARIFAAHPDFAQMVNTPEYQNFMAQRDGLSSETRDARASREYLNGNTDYVIDLLNQFKQSRNNAVGVATVPPVQVAPGAAPAAAQTTPTRYTLRELNNLFQTRQISAEEYRKLLPEARKAAVESLSSMS
jgi:hypothetical protein